MHTHAEDNGCVSSALKGIEDIVTLTTPDEYVFATLRDEVSNAHEATDKEIIELKKSVREYESATVKRLEQSAEMLLEEIKNCIGKAATEETDIREYEGSKYNAYSDMKRMSYLSRLMKGQHEDNGEIYDELWTFEEGRKEQASERETEGIWEMIDNRTLSMLTGMATAMATGFGLEAIDAKCSGWKIKNGATGVVDDVGDVKEGNLNSGLTQFQIDDIINTPKGSRPTPSSYLSQDYIDAHLAQFDDGVSVIQTEWAYGRYSETNGFVGVLDDNTLFVLPKKYCDEVIAKASGDISIIETELGFPVGYFSDGGGLVRIDVEDVSGLNIRMPSGNETGANSLWLPGGKTSGGVPEAITDIIPLDRTDILRINVD